MGMFSNNIYIFNKIIKYSFQKKDVRDILFSKTNANSIQEYYEKTNQLEIKTAKIFKIYNLFYKGILIIQERIRGFTLEETLMDSSITIEYKLKLIKIFFEIYTKFNMQDKYLLDWNLKNFIISENTLFFVDFTPVLIKEHILSLNQESLYQVKESYINEKVRLIGIFDYLLYCFIDIDKNDFEEVFKYLKKTYFFEYGLNLDELGEMDKNHIYIKRCEQLLFYINNNITKDELKETFINLSMQNTTLKGKGR